MKREEYGADYKDHCADYKSIENLQIDKDIIYFITIKTGSTLNLCQNGKH